MGWKEVGSAVANVGADLLADALPFPGAGMAVDALADAFGVGRDPDELAKAIKKDPKAAAKVAKIEADHEAALAQEVSKRQREVNETMRVGYENGVLWRRAVGWSLAISAPLFMLALVSLSGYALVQEADDMMKAIPEVAKSTDSVWYVFLAVLGVTGYQEGKLGRALAGEKGGKGLKIPGLSKD